MHKIEGLEASMTALNNRPIQLRIEVQTVSCQWAVLVRPTNSTDMLMGVCLLTELLRKFDRPKPANPVVQKTGLFSREAGQPKESANNIFGSTSLSD